VPSFAWYQLENLKPQFLAAKGGVLKKSMVSKLENRNYPSSKA